MNSTPEPIERDDWRDYENELTGLEFESTKRPLTPEETQRLQELRDHQAEIKNAVKTNMQYNNEDEPLPDTSRDLKSDTGQYPHNL